MLFVEAAEVAVIRNEHAERFIVLVEVPIEYGRGSVWGSMKNRVGWRSLIACVTQIFSPRY